MFRLPRALVCAAMLAAAAACSGSDSSQPADAPAPDARKVDAATAATITGKVRLEGTPPENPVIRMTSDSACASANAGGEVRAESFVVDNGALQNVFVYIRDGLGNKYLYDTPGEPVKLDQKGCRYTPHVVGLRVAQPLEVHNSDSTLHNVHGMPEKNREFNVGQPVPGMKNTVTFTAPEVMIPFKCDVHAWMISYVGVVNHPYFAVTGGGGTFELKTVPPGTYTIEAWHEKLGRQEQSVTVGEKESKDVTFTFKVAAGTQ